MGDFFVEDEKVVINKAAKAGDTFLNQKAEEVTEKPSPSGFVPVKLSSGGKLKGVPAVVHIKDYSGRDTLNLSMVTPENQIETLLKVIENITYENIDAGNLHENDLEEILINVFLNFWANAITDVPFPLIYEEVYNLEEEQKEKYKNRTWVPRTDLILSKIKTKDLDDEFMEPITIVNENKKVKFILPRIGHMVRASKLVARKYIKEESRWSKVNSAIRKQRPSEDDVDDLLKDVLGEEYFDYIEFSKNKIADYLMVKQALCLYEVNGEVLETIDEKIKAYDDVPLSMWEKFGEIQNTYGFGVNHNIEVISPLDNKPVERRFSFRLQDFFPSVRGASLSECSVSFGE
jgi:hypothetical protein